MEAFVKKILVIDDDAIQRRLLTTLLGKVGGYEVLTAENGRLGLERAEGGAIRTRSCWTCNCRI